MVTTRKILDTDATDRRYQSCPIYPVRYLGNLHIICVQHGKIVDIDISNETHKVVEITDFPARFDRGGGEYIDIVRRVNIIYVEPTLTIRVLTPTAANTFSIYDVVYNITEGTAAATKIKDVTVSAWDEKWEAMQYFQVPTPGALPIAYSPLAWATEDMYKIDLNTGTVTSHASGFGSYTPEPTVKLETVDAISCMYIGKHVTGSELYTWRLDTMAVKDTLDAPGVPPVEGSSRAVICNRWLFESTQIWPLTSGGTVNSINAILWYIGKTKQAETDLTSITTKPEVFAGFGIIAKTAADKYFCIANVTKNEATKVNNFCYMNIDASTYAVSSFTIFKTESGGRWYIYNHTPEFSDATSKPIVDRDNQRAYLLIGDGSGTGSIEVWEVDFSEIQIEEWNEDIYGFGALQPPAPCETVGRKILEILEADEYLTAVVKGFHFGERNLFKGGTVYPLIDVSCRGGPVRQLATAQFETGATTTEQKLVDLYIRAIVKHPDETVAETLALKLKERIENILKSTTELTPVVGGLKGYRIVESVKATLPLEEYSLVGGRTTLRLKL